MTDWKEQAKALFFIDHLNIGTVAKILRLRRETVSRYLTGCEGYKTEMENRKAQNAAKRKEYQRDWDRGNRAERYRHISGETMRVEHEMAVKELSREKYY